ncbi:MAG: hypothetical protein ACJ77Z_19100 [Thermoleophilaceae bacterium]|jgi:hypothetical protein
MFIRTPSPVLSGLAHHQIPEGPTIELWDAWAFAEVDSEFALRRWWEATTDGERADAFAVYTAALEREAQAAKALQARLSVVVGTGSGPV